MKKAIFNKPSTFTYIGRHASELKFLLNRAKSRNEILDIGPGPFEPFTIAALSPASRITVIDSNPKILQMVRSIGDGVLLQLSEAAKFCCNVANDGSPRKNSDLVDKRRVQKGFEELFAAGVNKYNFAHDNFGNFGYRGNSTIITMEPMDISQAKPWKQYDVVFEGLVLLNLRKTLGEQEFDSTLQTLFSLTKQDGTLGIATTPAGIQGEREYLSTLIRLAKNKRFHLQELFLDNIVDAGSRGLHGGYLATFAESWDSAIDANSARFRIMSETLLQNAKIVAPYIEISRLFDLLKLPNILLLYAIHAGGDHYHTMIAELDSMSIPKERYQFKLMASIK